MEIFWLCLGFVALPFVLWGLLELLRAYVLPAKQMPAKLKTKEAAESETFTGKTVKIYRLVFEIDGEKKRSWRVSKEQYVMARPGMTGTLTVRGRRYLSFDR